MTDPQSPSPEGESGHKEHSHIWLEPACAENGYEGRQWCQDNVWGDRCSDCDAVPVKFVRADIAEARISELEAALRPFAEAYRNGEVRLSEFLEFCRQGHFARAAELVPEDGK